GSVADALIVTFAGAVNTVPLAGAVSVTVGGRFELDEGLTTVSVSATATVACEVLWLVTARPTNTSSAIGTASAPTDVQFCPSSERKASISEPVRTRRIQPGAAPDPHSAQCCVAPPGLSMRPSKA